MEATPRRKAETVDGEVRVTVTRNKSNVSTGKYAGKESITYGSSHNDIAPTLPDGTPLLTEEENRRRQSGTGSHAAHVAQADEEREDKLREEGAI